MRSSVSQTASEVHEPYPFKTLPDYLRPGLDIVFVGINPGEYSVNKGHYFARKTSRFWPAFSKSRLSVNVRQGLRVETLGPDHDSELVRFGIGFTDVIKRPTPNASGLMPLEFQRWSPILLAKLRQYSPRVACFHGLTGFRPFLRYGLTVDRIGLLGGQTEVIGRTHLFVVPNPSPANAHFKLLDQVEWYDRLADFLDGCEEQSSANAYSAGA